MFSRLEWMIAGRYLRARRKEGAISVIAGFSLVGILLGVGALIVVMSVMNGFRAELVKQIVGAQPHVLVLGPAGEGVRDYEALAEKLKQVDGVTRAAPRGGPGPQYSPATRARKRTRDSTVSMVGVGVIVSGGSLDRLLHLRLLPGDAVIVLAVIFYALYSVLLRRRPQVHPLSFLAASFALGALMLLPVFVWEHLTLRQVVLEPAAMAALGYVVIFPSLLAYLCFNRGVELMGANRAGQFLHLMPVYGSALAAVFLGEALHGYHVAGAAMIALGIVMARRAQAPKP